MTGQTATPEGCRYLAVERVNAEEAIDRISELLKIAEHKGDEVRMQVYSKKLTEKQQRLSALIQSYRELGCRQLMDDESEHRRTRPLDLGTRGKQ
jgi:glycerol-3-phosphate dehydrogenase